MACYDFWALVGPGLNRPSVGAVRVDTFDQFGLLARVAHRIAWAGEGTDLLLVTRKRTYRRPKPEGGERKLPFLIGKR